MVEAGFMVSSHIHSNEKGACLVIVADTLSPEGQ